MREVVLAGHVFAVALGRPRELRIGHQGALAVRFAFLIDQAENRRTDQAQIFGPRSQVRVRAGAGGTGIHRCGTG